MTSKTTIYNRHGEPRIIKQHDSCYYTIEGPTIDIGCRGSRNENGDVTMFDPPGGPYIAVGCSMKEFGGRTIVSMIPEHTQKDYFKYTIEVEP